MAGKEAGWFVEVRGLAIPEIRESRRVIRTQIFHVAAQFVFDA